MNHLKARPQVLISLEYIVVNISFFHRAYQRSLMSEVGLQSQANITCYEEDYEEKNEGVTRPFVHLDKNEDV